MDGEGSGPGPPKEHQFKSGQSGNPRGRPKGARNLRSDLSDLLGKRVAVRENGKARRITRQQAMLLGLFDKAVHGDVKATISIMNMILKLEPAAAAQFQPDMLSEMDQMIIEDFLRRHSKPGDES